VGLVWLCGKRKIKRMRQGFKRILFHLLGYCNFGIWVMKAFFWNCVVCVTLERGKEQGIVLHLYYFNEKWSKDSKMFCVNLSYYKCHNCSFGLTTKAKAWKGVGWKCNLGVTFALRECEAMNPHTPKWTPILGVGNPYGVSNVQKNSLKVKTHWMK
jgi:hypothetical protein